MRSLFKNRLWLIKIPVVLAFTAAFWIFELGSNGELTHVWAAKHAYESLNWVWATTTDLKFQLRGKLKPKEPKIVIVDIDELTVNQVHEKGLGRWPWHRDLTARLIENSFKFGAKYVGLDVIFSEADPRVSLPLKEALTNAGVQLDLAALETDTALEQVIQKYKERLVLGWFSPVPCRPAFEKKEECDVANNEAILTLPPAFGKFALTLQNVAPGFNHETTPLESSPVVTSNLPSYDEAALHSGFFDPGQDPDGIIRRAPLVRMVNGLAVPSLALEMARLVRGEDLRVDLDSSGRISWLGFAKSGKPIPVSRYGAIQINARGGRETFDYVKAFGVLFSEELDQTNRTLASFGGTVAQLQEKLKDAYVFIGTSAAGSYDLRNFSFESNVPGVEGHATILDNLLAGDALISSAQGPGKWVILFFMVIVALALAYGSEKISAIPAIILFAVTFMAFGLFDVAYLFQNNQNWNTGFFYLELMTVFGLSIAAKYIAEEKNKRQLKNAFSKYVSPAIVDSIVKDPDKLSLGGERKDLTILFSDIRGFTTFSEKLDAKVLSSFLNDYLGIMTDIVFAQGGTLDKYIGDAVMAFWGAPLEQKDHAVRATVAARLMLEALAQNQPRFKSQYGIDVDVGIGINSGTVSVGNMGCEQNFEYTVIGDNVNLASRLEGLTKEYRAHALATRATLDLILGCGGKLPPHRVLDFVKVKGKKVAVELIEILKEEFPKEGAEAFQRARGLYTQRKWDEAAEEFKNAKRICVDDPPCEMFLERIAEIKADSAAFGPDWDGAWVMHSK